MTDAYEEIVGLRSRNLFDSVMKDMRGNFYVPEATGQTKNSITGKYSNPDDFSFDSIAYAHKTINGVPSESWDLYITDPLSDASTTTRYNVDLIELDNPRNNNKEKNLWFYRSYMDAVDDEERLNR